MVSQDTKTATIPSGQAVSKNSDNAYTELVNIWWPVLLLLLFFVVGGLEKYYYHNNIVLAIVQDLIKAMGVLMLAVYVIYTRLLAVETRKMAEASIGLYSAEKGTVLGELVVSVCDFAKLPDKVRQITEEIHVNEKKLPVKDFTRLMADKDIPAIILKIKNISARRIEARNVVYKVRHTGTTNFHEIQCDISIMGTIKPWEDKEIPLILSPEGEVEIIIDSIDYLDGGIEQRIRIDKSIEIAKIREPEKR